ncbi:MAG: PGF-pre-PGF domain-containing protein [Candidatus Methanoperedens sp.]|nr:PGF-pre-PGF domain-containing protein [Candidatus Methanoperedens sp.]
MRKNCLDKIFGFLLVGLLLFAAASGIASAFNLEGNTYNITKSPLNNTIAIVEEYSFGQMGPALLGSYTNTSNEAGYFNVSGIPDNESSNFKIILRHFNATTGNLDYIGQSLPMFPYFETAQLAMGQPVDFFLKQGGTVNLTATNGSYSQNFSYMVKDTKLGYPIVENFATEVSNATIYLPADRNYSIMIYPNRSFPVSFDLRSSLLNSSSNYVANVSFNTSNTLRKVSGYANLSNGSANFGNLTVIAYLMEPGNMIFQDYPLPYNMSQWCQYGPSPCEGDVYNATTGYYNITLPGAAMTANILLFATANISGEYYGIFRNVSLGYSEEPVTNFNFTLQPLLGSETNINITNAGGGGGGPSTVSITTKKLAFVLKNSTGANINNAHVEVEVNYSAYNGSAFNWMADVSATSSGQFKIPAINASINKINIYTQGSAPLKTSKTAAQLATSPVRINLSSFNPGDLKNETNFTSYIVMDMLKSIPACDVPNPLPSCSLFPSGQQMNMSQFSPLKVVVGGGKISMRMTLPSNGITVHYKNVDMLASGPPDALFDSSGNESQNGSSLEKAWRFGSMGPEIYDEVLIGMPLGTGINPTNVSVKLGKLFDENWNAVWNISENNITQLPSDYGAFNATWFAPSGMPCSTSDQTATCYVNTTGRMIWVTIPHFSGVGPTITGTSGNFTANMTNSSGTAGSSAVLNFTLSDTSNTTSWYNITFPAGFNAGSAVVNVTINGSVDPADWNKTAAPLFVNVTSTSAAVANISTNQYIAINGITVPSTTGNYTVNVTTSNNLIVSLNYTATMYGANLTVDSNARTTTTSTNATYTLTLQNNGSETDIYNLTIDNPGAATVALNPSGNITLASSAVQTLLLNVTNTTAGTFRVNVTARSNNNASKFGYINTTTTVYAATYSPPAPNGLANTSGNFWVNHTWQAGTGNVTNSYNVSVNGSWTNGTASTYYNNTVGAHGWSNITVLAYNSSGSGSLNSTPVSQNTRVANNAPSQSAIGNKNVTVSNVLSFTVSATDADSDTITYGTNASKGTLIPATGEYSWTPGAGEAGTYTWYFNSSDSYGVGGNETITVTVISYGVSLTSSSGLTGNVGNTTPLPNATYILNLTNNGTASDSYTITVDNPNRAPTAALNITSPVSLSAGQTRIFSLNVTSNLSGTFNVNITARSDNDTARVGYINTTTTVNRTIVDTTIVSFINLTFIVNTTLNIAAPSGNVTVTIPNGTNASVNGAALGSISLDSLALVNSTFAVNLSSSNKFIGQNLSLGPDGALFSPDIQIRFNYTHSQLTAAGMAESELAVKFYNTTTGAWESLAIYERNTTADYIIANASHFSTFALIGVPATTTTTTSSSSGGGGSGGGGLVTSEPYDNIAKAESYEKSLIAGAPVIYAFKVPEHGVYEIAVTGRENENYIALRVEALKGTSKLVTQNPPGTVYKNLNVLAGTKKITGAVIKFKVENSWLENNKFAGNDVKMVKWDGIQWVKLETSGSGKDGDYTYFEAKTDTFSSFAITVPEAASKPVAGETPSKATPSSTPARTTDPTPTRSPGFEMILAVIAIGILYLMGRKR